MFRNKFSFTKLVILLCLLSLIHGKKCIGKPKIKVIKNTKKIKNEIETTIPNPIDSGSDSDSKFENNIKTIINSQAIEVSSSTLIPSETEAIVFTSTAEVSSSTHVPTETKAIVFTSTTIENDEPTMTSSPIPTETIDEYEDEDLIEYDLKIKLDNTDEFKDTLNDLKNKYPDYFKNYKSSSDYICDDQCFLNKLALRWDFKVSHGHLPPDEINEYYLLVIPFEYDKGFNGYFYIYTYSNDAIMEKVQKKFEKYIVSYTKLDKVEKEDFDLE
ncbi:hypothetical protein BCR32DRAFT_248214 [Anaeromyces robustus]|uniref:Uncharacterized protein n=1 Tax=Anaeromyces robustus TaxID=1754192 RepID=A0A1Y1WV75_9FUNG|nr:hypothetical protein BCR32DRAFT_248214 [Anaeromyces robustus]|eukprot:ORX77116.1 hypothetical protein BCR32DRAFT_248214 [Anaeromyces robustus]